MSASLKHAALPLAALLLAGCAAPAVDGGFGLTSQTARERLGKEAVWVRTDGDAAAVRSKIRTLLERPLTADDAVQVALYNNPGLQAAYAELGISDSDLRSAGRLENPRFSFMRAINSENSVKIESLLSFGVMSLLTLPLRLEAAGRRFESTRRGVTAEMLGVAADTRKAYYQALAARQTLAYMAMVKESTEAGAELARRMARAGNFSALSHMREHAFHAEAAAQLARSQHADVAAREKLTRLMGLADASAFTLPERLPEVPKAARDEAAIAAEAMQERLDVAAARLEAEALASSLGLTRVTRFTNVLEIGRARVDEGQEPRKRGWEVAFDIPLFDFGGSKVARAEARYMQAAGRIRETVINAGSEVREAYSSYRTRHDLARHYADEIVPLRRKISDEVQLRYNGMLSSVFELLADSREQVLAVNGAIEAQRDFWIAESDLQMALVGKPSGLSPGLGTSLPSAAAPGAAPH